MTKTPVTTQQSWLATGIASCAMVAIATMALWSVTFAFGGWTTESIRHQQVQANPPILHALRLNTSTGAHLVPWGSGSTRPRIWLVTFMYTRCPTFCAALGNEFEHLQRPNKADAQDADIGLLSISFDPSHDSVTALQVYANNHHAEPDRWTVAVPDSGIDLDRVERETGTVVLDNGSGGFAHNAAIHVVRADGRLIRIFNLSESESALAWARSQL